LPFGSGDKTFSTPVILHYPVGILIFLMEAFRALLDESDRFSWFTALAVNEIDIIKPD